MSAPNAARAAELARRTPRSSASTISGSGSRSTTVPSVRRSCSINAERAAPRRASRSRSMPRRCMPGSTGKWRDIGLVRRNAVHAVRQQIDIARPAQRQHHRREERRTDPQQHGTDRGPSHRRQQDQGSDRDSGDRRPSRHRPHGYPPSRPGLTRPSTAFLRRPRQDVDGRAKPAKPGHDGRGVTASPPRIRYLPGSTRW